MNWEMLVDLIFGPALLVTAFVMFDYMYQVRYQGSDDTKTWRYLWVFFRLVIGAIAFWHLCLGFLMTVNQAVSLIMGGGPWD